MGIFRRKHGVAQRAADVHEEREAPVEDSAEDAEDVEDTEEPEPAATPNGPFDAADAPDDGVARIDLGSVRVPVPQGAQVQVEMDPPSGSVKAVHIVTEAGQVTVSAYAAPRSGGLWREVSAELTEQLRADGAKVAPGAGEWGTELSAVVGETALRFIGVDGPRWMLRGVIAGPQSQAASAPSVLSQIVQNTVVVRGDSPMPVRTPLPITLPEAVAEHIAEQQAEQQTQQES